VPEIDIGLVTRTAGILTWHWLLTEPAIWPTSGRMLA